MVSKAPVGTGWQPLAPAAQADFFLSLPERRYGKRFPFVCLPRDGNGTGRREDIWLTERDGSPRYLGGTGQDGTGSWNGSGTVRETGREHSRESYIVGKTVGNKVGKSVRKSVGTRLSRTVGNAISVAGWRRQRLKRGK